MGWLGAQLLVSLLVEYRAIYLGAHFQHNHVIYNAYMVLEFILINAMLMRSGTGTAMPRWSAVLGAVAYLVGLLWSIHAGWTEPHLWTNALIIGGSILGVHAAFVLFTMARDGQQRLLEEPYFWIVLAVMVYFLCFIPVFGLYNYLSARSEELAMRVYAINDLLFLLRYGLTLAGLILLARSSLKKA